MSDNNEAENSFFYCSCHISQYYHYQYHNAGINEGAISGTDREQFGNRL